MVNWLSTKLPHLNSIKTQSIYTGINISWKSWFKLTTAVIEWINTRAGEGKLKQEIKKIYEVTLSANCCWYRCILSWFPVSSHTLMSISKSQYFSAREPALSYCLYSTVEYNINKRTRVSLSRNTNVSSHLRTNIDHSLLHIYNIIGSLRHRNTQQDRKIPHVLSPWQVVLDAGPVDILKTVVFVSCFNHTMWWTGQVKILTISLHCRAH